MQKGMSLKKMTDLSLPRTKAACLFMAGLLFLPEEKVNSLIEKIRRLVIERTGPEHLFRTYRQHDPSLDSVL